MAAALADQLLLQTLGQLHIVAGLHGVLATALGAGAQVGSIAEHLGQGDKGIDLLGAGAHLVALNLATAGIQITDDVAHILVGYDNAHLHDGLQQEHDYLYWEFPGGKGWVAVRWGDWKGLLRKVKEGNTQLELYDVRHDLLEEHDVAADHPDVVARMWEFIRASHTEPENPLFKMEIPEV